MTGHSRRPVSTPNSVVGDPGREEDPFRYGWRYVKRKLRNGRVDYDQIPDSLTLSARGTQSRLSALFYAYIGSTFLARIESGTGRLIGWHWAGADDVSRPTQASRQSVRTGRMITSR